jgi:cell division topological specificity factor
MSSFIDRFMNRKQSTPAQSAKDRLKFVLVTDRTTITPEELKRMQAEILDVIRKYCRINEDDVEMKFEQRDRESFLVADIPLAAGNRRDEKGSYMRLETNLVIDESPVTPFDTQPSPPPPNMPAAPATLPQETSETTASTPAPAEDKVQVQGAPTGLQSESTPPTQPSQENKPPST